jgi:hypothetical protein
MDSRSSVAAFLEVSVPNAVPDGISLLVPRGFGVER